MARYLFCLLSCVNNFLLFINIMFKLVIEIKVNYHVFKGILRDDNPIINILKGSTMYMVICEWKFLQRFDVYFQKMTHSTYSLISRYIHCIYLHDFHNHCNIINYSEQEYVLYIF